MTPPTVFSTGRPRGPGLRILLMLGLWACGDGPQGPAGGPPARLEVVAGGGQTGTVGQVLGDPIVARVTDDAGRGVAGVRVTFVAPDGNGVFTPDVRITDERGLAQAAWTLGPHAGTLSATVTIEGLAPEPLSAVAVARAAARLAFEAIPEGASVGLAFDPPVAVVVQDEFGNLVPGSSAEILLRLNQGTLVGAASARAVNGRATFPGLHIDQPGTGYVLTASAEGLSPAESAPFPVATGAVAQIQVAAGDGQEAAAGSAVPIAPTVVVRDADGNPIAGAGVTFAVTGGGGTVSPATVVTGADGRAAPAEWTLGTTVGENTLRASPAALPGASVEFTAGAIPGPVDPSRSTLTATPETIFTGATSVIEVTALDAFGNPIPGVAVVLTAGGSGNTLVQPAATDANGQASGSFRSANAGTRTVSAEAGGVVLDQQATIVVEPPPAPASVQVTPAESSLLVDQTAQLTATVLDDRDQPIEGAAVAWSSDDPQVASVDAGGVVTARRTGSATITATSDGKSGSALVSVSLGEGTLTNVTYCTIGGVEDKMDVYIPSASKPRPLPVAVHVHGGGWTSGSRSTGTQFAEVKQALLDRGYLVVSLDYRLAPAHKYPAQIQDVKCAIRHLRARAGRYGLDVGNIGAWGGSAGGQLVALLGTADAGVGFDDVGGFQGESSEVQAVIALSAITDFTHPDELRDDYGRVFQTWPDPESPEMIEASPVTHVGAGDAPFFFIVGDEDELVLPAQSVRMNQRLQAVGVPSSLLRVLHADHDLQSTGVPTDPGFETIKTRMTEFFDQQLR